MTLLPDPAEIDAAARRVAAHATAARHCAAVLARSAEATEWHGAAAAAFAHPARDTEVALRRAADGLDAAAGALHRHARAVEQALAVLRQVALRTGRTVYEVVDTLGNLGAGLEGDVEHLSDRILGGVATRTVHELGRLVGS